VKHTLTCLLGLLIASPGCAPAARPKACAALAARLCQGSSDAAASCKATLDLLTPEACSVALQNVASSLSKLAARNKQCDDLIVKLCADLGPGSHSCENMQRAPRDLTPAQCASMQREYPDVLAELRRQDEQSKPLAPEAQAKLLAGQAPGFGPADARVHVVEFSDFQCPFCSRAADTVHAIRKKYGDKVHFVFRQYPLSFHEHAQAAAEASLAAHAQGKFWELHDRLFANQGALDRGSLERYAREAGLDVTELGKALDSGRYRSAVDAELALGEEVAVDGTPTLFINGRRVDDPGSVEHVSELIERALAGGSGS
jgi:protein-disulfide isomerase